MSAPTVIHPTALVDAGAELGSGVTIGPFAVVEGETVLGDGVRVGPHAHIARRTTLGAQVQVFTGAAVGNICQDLKYAGEDTTLEVGPRTIIREFCTLHRGSAASVKTVIGADCLLMDYVHVAHDCVLGDHCIIANTVQIGGHVHLGEWVTIGGSTPIHQFVRVGDHAMVGGGFRIVQDVPPYLLAAGEPLTPRSINTVGLSRRGFNEDTIAVLKRAYRILFRSGLGFPEGIRRVRGELPDLPEIENLLAFIESSERGIIG